MIQSICICGAGTMGAGIAQIAAQSGFGTIVYDLSNEMLDKAEKQIAQGLQFLIEKRKISEQEKDAVLNRIRFVHDIDECKADLVIEAIVEKLDAKIALFNSLISINSEKSIFVSNTSSLSVSAIASEVKHPGRIAGMHFFNPAPVMKLVEVVRTNYTDEATINEVTATAKAMGKIPVICNDSPGFIVNHVARPYYLEALRLLETGVADIETIDSLLESSGFKMGPFRLMDLIGNDINYAASCSVYDALGKPERLRPSTIQKLKVSNGELGKKTKRGYYKYEVN